MDLEKKNFKFYSDSQIVLGYITNDARRFYVYVANRVSRIRSFSELDQWQHVTIDQNLTDLGTRSFDAQELPQSMWLRGPAFLREHTRTLLSYQMMIRKLDVLLQSTE